MVGAGRVGGFPLSPSVYSSPSRERHQGIDSLEELF